MKKPIKKTRKQLERELLEVKAQLASTYHFADAALQEASQKVSMGSGVILEITGLGGRGIIPPVCIRDGLSDQTIAALREDLGNSYDLATVFKPKGKT